MPWFALILLSLAVFFWRYGRRQPDEVVRFLGFSLALVCVMASLVAAPGPLKILLLAGLIVYPTCAPAERGLKPTCPRLCLLRHQCRHARNSSPF